MADPAEDATLSVLDLPQLHKKPSAATILDTLSQLKIHPCTFNQNLVAPSLKIDETGVTGYLTRFIASPLAWIASEEEREEIWEAASQRLSERSGRMAMSSISRTFTICDHGVKRDGTAPRYIPIQVNEPSLTDDNLGHKTWTGSFLLAERLPHTMTKYFPTLLPPPNWERQPSSIATESGKLPQTADVQKDSFGNQSLQIPSPPPSPVTLPSDLCQIEASSLTNQPSEPVKVLELGSGTGLTGIAAAAIFTNIAVHLTDLPSIVPNIVANVETNSHLCSHNPTTAVLDWSNLPDHVAPKDRYDCILAADSLYDPQHPDWLTNAMVVFLDRNRGARMIVELPFRDMDLPYHDLLRENMDKKGFVLLEEGNDLGYDDWEGAWCEKMAVECWWSVWGWAESQLEQVKALESEGKEDPRESFSMSKKPEHVPNEQPEDAGGTATVATPAAEPMTESRASTNDQGDPDLDMCPTHLTESNKSELS